MYGTASVAQQTGFGLFGGLRRIRVITSSTRRALVYTRAPLPLTHTLALADSIAGVRKLMIASKAGCVKAACFVGGVVPGIDAAKPLPCAEHCAAAPVFFNLDQGSALAAALIEPDPR